MQKRKGRLGAMEWALDIILVGLLAATLFHALRLERALGVLKRDRAALEELANGFNSSTRTAEQATERLRGAADGAGRQIAKHIETALSLREDLRFLVERGDTLADRLEVSVRAGRAMPQGDAAPAQSGGKRMRSQAERDLLKALRMGR
jgi:hypothetical protein